MPTESERKFLVVDDGWRAETMEASPIRQLYLFVGPDRSVRLRFRADRTPMLAFKFGAHARNRQEYEYPVPMEEAEEMARFAVGNVIEKTRNLVRHRGYVYEVDEFSGALAGLVVAELETEDEVADADLPAWLGMEITGNPAYYNASLALNGLPEPTL
ncbi:CYTH domain-containing protein [Nitratireductor luteus]|uniref:CYTH domain-containing protein n=1 Tax=Nitratireductor luteus TaxID=2976980 RepID=UPI002240D1C6|nr:CYTH domain-containing protein [Nitratireductor luteus]